MDTKPFDDVRDALDNKCYSGDAVKIAAITEEISCQLSTPINQPVKAKVPIHVNQQLYGPPQTTSTATLLEDFTQNANRDESVLVYDDQTKLSLRVTSPLNKEGDTLENGTRVTISINKKTGTGFIISAEC